MKNDNIDSFFAILVAYFEFAGFAPEKKKYTAWTVTTDTVRLQNRDRVRINQRARIYLKLALSCDNPYFLLLFSSAIGERLS